MTPKGTAGFEPFTDQKGQVRCGRKSKSPKPKSHATVKWLVKQGVSVDVARYRCLKAPVKGRDCCRLHGGATPILHGLYSKYPIEGLRDKIIAARANPKLRDLTEQLAIVAAAMNHSLEELDQVQACGFCGQSPERSLAVADRISRIAERFSRIVERHERITEGIKIKLLTEAREDLVARFTQALQAEGIEGEQLRRIAAQLRS